MLDRARRLEGLGKGVKEGRIWTYLRDDQPWGGTAPRGIAYFFSPDRKSVHPQGHLAEFSGILRADAYTGFKAWAETQLGGISGKSALAKDFRYALRRWPSFKLFLEDGRVAIDNNSAERAIKPVVIGRKNWFFAGADAGGETLAEAMTIIESAKLSGHDPEAYFADILARIGDHKINRLDELLPWDWVPMAREAKAVA